MKPNLICRCILTIVVVIFSAACSTEVQKKRVNSTFNPTEIEWFWLSGNNEISGSALIQQRGGGVVTCAGRKVILVPASTHADERINLIYGNTNAGYSRFGSVVLDVDNDQKYKEAVASTLCDAQGYFNFRKLPDGRYYVITRISWGVSTTEGGSLMKGVELKNGISREIVLAP